MKKTISFLILAVFLTVGGGCASSDAPIDDANVDNNDTVPVEDTAPAEPIAYSELTQNILDAQEIYKEFRFTNGTGTCVDQGFTDSFSYLEDEELGYFVLESTDKSYYESYVMATMANYLAFEEVALTDGEAKCSFKIPFGTDEGTLKCEIDEVEICTATYQGTAIGR